MGVGQRAAIVIATRATVTPGLFNRRHPTVRSNSSGSATACAEEEVLRRVVVVVIASCTVLVASVATHLILAAEETSAAPTYGATCGVMRNFSPVARLR